MDQPWSVDDVLAPITPETLAALVARDREIAVLKQRAARMAELVESTMRACESFGRDVLLADNELIVYLEREVELRRNSARARNKSQHQQQQQEQQATN